MALSSIPILLFTNNNPLKEKYIRDKKLVVLGILDGAFYIASLYTFIIASSYGYKIISILILETWPILLSIIITPFIKRAIIKIGYYELTFSSLSIIGIVVLSTNSLVWIDGIHQNRDLIYTVIFSLLSMILMAVATALKAKASEILYTEYNIGAFKGYLSLQLMYIPLMPLALIPYFFENESFIIIIDYIDVFMIFLIFILNFLSAYLYTYGTLYLKRASDTYIWFFTSVFSIILVSIIEVKVPIFNELIGIALIISSNILIVFKIDSKISYIASIVSLLITGTICSYIPGSNFSQYFDALGVLTIFFVVILSFLISQTSNRNGVEVSYIGSMLRKIEDFQEDDGIYREVAKNLLEIQNKRNKVLIRRCYWKTIRAIKLIPCISLRAEIRDDLEKYISSRIRGVTAAETFALSGSVYVSIMIGILARGHGWEYDIFVTMYVPSLIFAFFTLTDIHSNRTALHYRKVQHFGGITFINRIKPQIVKKDMLIWSIILIVFVILIFTMVFFYYENRFFIDRARLHP